MRITTDNKEREVLEADALTPEQREQFDYLDWDAIDAGDDSRFFVQYEDELLPGGELIDLGDHYVMLGEHVPVELVAGGWTGWNNVTNTRGMCSKFTDEWFTNVIIGRWES